MWSVTFRPVALWNAGKKEEFRNRKPYNNIQARLEMKSKQSATAIESGMTEPVTVPKLV